MPSSVLTRATTEAELQQTITDACDYLGLPWFHIRISTQNPGVGFPDLVVADWRSGIVRFWELKTERGIIRPKQQEWLAQLAVCRDVDVQVIRPVQLDWALEELAR